MRAINNGWVVCWVVTTLAMVGCGGGGEPEEAGSEATSGEETSEYEGAITSTDTAKGAEVFANFCDDCHPDGEEDAGPSLIAEPHSPARLRQQIREGSGRMRPFSSGRISDEDMEALLAYLASINAVK